MTLITFYMSQRKTSEKLSLLLASAAAAGHWSDMGSYEPMKLLQYPGNHQVYGFCLIQSKAILI